MSQDDAKRRLGDASSASIAISQRIAALKTAATPAARPKDETSSSDGKIAAGMVLVAGEAAAGLFGIEKRVRAAGGRGGGD